MVCFSSLKLKLALEDYRAAGLIITSDNLTEIEIVCPYLSDH